MQLYQQRILYSFLIVQNTMSSNDAPLLVDAGNQSVLGGSSSKLERGKTSQDHKPLKSLRHNDAKCVIHFDVVADISINLELFWDWPPNQIPSLPKSTNIYKQTVTYWIHIHIWWSTLPWYSHFSEVGIRIHPHHPIVMPPWPLLPWSRSMGIHEQFVCLNQVGMLGSSCIIMEDMAIWWHSCLGGIHSLHRSLRVIRQSWRPRDRSRIRPSQKLQN